MSGRTSLFTVVIDVIFPFGFFALSVSPLSVAVTLNDMYNGRINKRDVCNQLNLIVLVDYIGHFLLTIILLIRRWYIFFFINLFVIAYHLYYYYTGKYYYDFLVIHRTDVYTKKVRYEYIKLAIYLSLAVYSIVKCVSFFF